MIALITAALVFAGSLLMLLAAIGIVRMPDVYIRLQASTKAASLGAGCLLLALALFYADLAVTTRAALAIVFIFLTVPVSGHMIARAAYLVGVALWEETRWDELRGRYDPETHQPTAPGSEGFAGPSADEEAQLLRLLREGRTDLEIADILGLAPRTVSARFEGILARRGARTRAEVLRIEGDRHGG